jgi:hypothetical protein
MADLLYYSWRIISRAVWGSEARQAPPPDEATAAVAEAELGTARGLQRQGGPQERREKC